MRASIPPIIAKQEMTQFVGDGATQRKRGVSPGQFLDTVKKDRCQHPALFRGRCVAQVAWPKRATGSGKEPGNDAQV